eukprot:CAMPEP_0198565488 /NCGR_PEP_ID=MMETSP1462-20131121/101865_1 /TAXON_ID=1333877 /ORGANISM="Brandtodinium nutriculum, Strain RCC3387" /LENGTH=49 /DNA_ID= /DNA_START= /DNA_END= /DNA_ORIENTATION=
MSSLASPPAGASFGAASPETSSLPMEAGRRTPSSVLSPVCVTTPVSPST